MITKVRKQMPVMILLGAILGVMIGVFFGDLVGFLKYIGEAYVQLLLMCVYPYIIASLLNGLGKMDQKIARKVFRKSWMFYVLAWLIVLVTMMILGSIFPAPTKPKVIFPFDQSHHIDLVTYFIPGNFLQSISSNYVPAVVVFAVFFGIAMQRIKNKDTFLEITDQIKRACVIIWNWIVFFAPIGVFALFAQTAATIEPQNIEGLLVYILVFFIIAIVLTFVIFPMIITAFVPISNRSLLRGIQSALLLAIVTSLAVIALPIIHDYVIKQSKERGIDDPHLIDIVGTQISIAYPLAQLGNLFVAFFILFSSYFFHSPLNISQYLLLPPLTLFSTFGSPSSAVNAVDFISSVYHSQGEFKELFVASSSITRFAQVAVSVMGFTFVTLLSTFSFYEKLVFKRSRLIRAGVVFILFSGLVFLGANSISSVFWKTSNISYHKFKISRDLVSGIQATIFKAGDTTANLSDSIQYSSFKLKKSRVLRVGYYDGFCPFSYINQWGDLVGFDVSLMYKLARDIDVKLEFYSIDPRDFINESSTNKLDIIIGGFIVTPQRLKYINISKPYFHTRNVILIRTDQVHRLSSFDDLAWQTDLVVGVYDNPTLKDIIQNNCPNNPIVIIDSYYDLPSHPEIDFVFWTLEKATAFAYLNPGFTVVVSEGVGSPLLFAFYMSDDTDTLEEYLNYWIDLQTTNGFIEQQKKYWISGKVTDDNSQGWCIIRDVLHWVN